MIQWIYYYNIRLYHPFNYVALCYLNTYLFLASIYHKYLNILIFCFKNLLYPSRKEEFLFIWKKQDLIRKTILQHYEPLLIHMPGVQQDQQYHIALKQFYKLILRWGKMQFLNSMKNFQKNLQELMKWEHTLVGN